MIRQHLQTEENFWPCVSDMFLALFVIALALYSVSSEEKGKGDEYISDLAKDEAVALIECMQKSNPNDAQLKELNPPAAKKADRKNLDSPELCKLLYAVVKNDKCEKHFPNGIDERLWNPNKPILKNVCRALCKATGDCNHTEGKYYQCIKAARERITSAVKDSLEADQKREMARLKRELKILGDANKGRAEDAARIAELEIQVESLEGEKARLTRTNEGLDDAIEKLTGENKDLKEEKIRLQNTNTGLQKQIREDFRKQVMQRVRTLLARYPDLHYFVIVLDEEGVVRIPSSTIGFDPSSVVPNPSETCNARQLESRLVQLAQFLNDVGQEVTKSGQEPLLVDNISIECHSSPDGKNKILGILSPHGLKPYKQNATIKLNNDWLSMLRAINIWEKLNEHANFNLKEYKNQKGLGLFSTTGCGARVCPKGVNPDARDPASLEKWRRIEIRFNCSPQRVPDTQPSY